MKNLFLLSLSLIVLSACSTEKKQDESSTENTTPAVSYEYQRAFTSLKWTAYKTTARIGVSGTFDEFEITPGKNTNTVKGLLDQLTFDIPVSTTNSENEERDGKIMTTFFGTMMNTQSITGSFKEVVGSDSAGMIKININMNDVDHTIEGTYTVINNKVEINASLKLADWSAEPNVQALNDVCEDLHKGEDGVSKLWPDVDLTIESTLKVNTVKNEKS